MSLFFMQSGGYGVTDVNALQILKVVEVDKTDDIRRPYIKQLMTKDLKFPLPHRNPPKTNKKIFAAKRPATFY
jgi:large subunit ribosomal protein L18Ae